MYDTKKIYNYSSTSVHHALPIEIDYSKRLDNDYLITMCSMHHKMAETGIIPLSTILEIIEEQENIPPQGKKPKKIKEATTDVPPTNT